jgi:hypothetical protein
MAAPIWLLDFGDRGVCKVVVGEGIGLTVNSQMIAENGTFKLTKIRLARSQ